jgi:hypothetical protein
VLPEDVLLLLIDQRTGHAVADRVVVENALAGAMLIELVHSGRLAYSGQLRVADATPPPHPFEESVTRLKAPVSPRLGVRTAVGSVLFGHRPPDARSGALISLLHALKRVHKVFDGERHELSARAKQIADGHSPAVVAVHDAVAAEVVLAETKVGFLR